jgi:hypothetical protein
LEFLEEAEQEFAVGKMMKGAEMLWGAVAHSLVPVALRQRRPYNSHGAMKDAARQLPNVPGQSDWLTEFDVAEECHSHFYHGHLTDEELVDSLSRVRVLVVRLLAVAQPADA